MIFGKNTVCGTALVMPQNSSCLSVPKTCLSQNEFVPKLRFGKGQEQRKFSEKTRFGNRESNRVLDFCLIFVDFFLIPSYINSNKKLNQVACLTQSAEYRSCKPKVIGSTPIAGFYYFGVL